MPKDYWYADGIAIVDERGRFIGNALDDNQARKIAWVFNDRMNEKERIRERTSLCEPEKK